MIEAKGINKSFGNQQVLFDVSAQFHPGKVNLIIGQSGQGKPYLPNAWLDYITRKREKFFSTVRTFLAWINRAKAT